MIGGRRGGLLAAAGIALALLVSACSTGGVTVNNLNSGSQDLAPVQGGTVSTSALPPLGPNGEVQGPNAANVPTGTVGTVPGTPDPFGGDTASTDGSFETLQPVGALPNSRDLSGGLTVEKLLGGWTIVSGDIQCKLNLTQTAKAGTDRYRASAPACGLAAMAAVASWQLSGNQVQLYAESGAAIATLILSGNRLIGTIQGGQGISMVG